MSLLKIKRSARKAEAKRPHAMHVLQSSEQLPHHGYAQNLRQRLAQAVGLTAVLGFILADFFSQGFSSIATLDWQLVALFLPFLLLPLALTFPYRIGGSSLRQYVLIGIFVSGVSLASYLGISRRQSSWFNQESLTLVTIYIYFLSGLPLFRAVFCGLVALTAFTIGEMGGASFIETLSASPYLLVANFVGAMGLFYLEWHSREMHQQEMRLRSDAMSDDLTSTLNRRAIHQHLRRVWLQARREDRGLCAVRMDIDNFRELNRRYGHQLADGAMRHISALLQAEVRRPLDAIGRSGTDEFLGIWYDCEPSRFAEMMKQLPKAVTRFHLGDSMDVEPLTISGGAVITYPQSSEDEEWEQFIECLDENLARARLNGRNQIVVTTFEPFPVSDAEHWSMKTQELNVASAD